MLRVAWNSAPSPQPSPQRGEGVGSCGIWSAMAARRNARALPIQRTSGGARRLAEALSNKAQAGVVGRLTTELAWNTASSPQPSPHRGEGVGSCTAWVTMPVCGDAGVTSILWRSHRVRLSAEVFSGRTQSRAVGRGSMLRVAWNTAPSPQPSPQRGEGVGSCTAWVAMPVRGDAGATPSDRRGHRAYRSDGNDARPASSIRRATHYQTTPFLRLTPSSPRPSGERVRVRGNGLQTAQEPQQ